MHQNQLSYDTKQSSLFMKKLRLLSVMILILLFSVCGSHTSVYAELLQATNETLTTYTAAYRGYMDQLLPQAPDLDSFPCIHSIGYMPKAYRTTTDGVPIADGYCSSLNGSFSVGAGCGIGEEYPDYWYVACTFTPDTGKDTVQANTQMLLISLKKIGVSLGDDTDDADDVIKTIIDFLEETGSVSIEIGNVVFFRKEIGNGRFLIGVNSLPFYNGMYAGTEPNYLTFDEIVDFF